MLALISDKPTEQASLFEDMEAKGKSTQLMTALDKINQRFGMNTVKTARAGTKQYWQMRSDNRSKRYTSRWEELPTAL